MSSLTFIWGEDENGDTGWVAQGYPHFNAIEPHQIGHDCMEHLPRGLKHGAIADELLALGARLHLRVESGWWFSQPFGHLAPGNTWAMEMVTLCRGIENGQAEPPIIVEPLLDTDMDAEIAAALVLGAKSANQELYYDNGDDDGPFSADNALFQSFGAWMRRGVRACSKRYKGKHPTDIMWLQEQLIEAASQKKYQYGESGDQLIIRIHEKDLEFQIIYKPAYRE